MSNKKGTCQTEKIKLLQNVKMSILFDVNVDDVTVTGNDVNVNGDVNVDEDVGFHVVQTSR